MRVPLIFNNTIGLMKNLYEDFATVSNTLPVFSKLAIALWGITMHGLAELS